MLQILRLKQYAMTDIVEVSVVISGMDEQDVVVGMVVLPSQKLKVLTQIKEERQDHKQVGQFSPPMFVRV